MIKIVADVGKRTRLRTRIDSIPLGQVFRGAVVSTCLGVTFPGVFYKAQGRFRHRQTGTIHDACLVRLDQPQLVADKAGMGSFANVCIQNTWVEDYEPLVATVTLTRG